MSKAHTSFWKLARISYLTRLVRILGNMDHISKLKTQSSVTLEKGKNDYWGKAAVFSTRCYHQCHVKIKMKIQVKRGFIPRIITGKVKGMYCNWGMVTFAINSEHASQKLGREELFFTMEESTKQGRNRCGTVG